MGRLARACELALCLQLCAASTTVYHAHDTRVFPCQPGARLSLNPVNKSQYNPLFEEDSPWEAAWENTYPTVAYDNLTRTFKLWYNTIAGCSAHDPGMCPHLGYNYSLAPIMTGRRALLLLAESTDGVSFVKPSLGLVDFNGNTDNNAVLEQGATDCNIGVLHDPLDTDPARAFKLFGTFPSSGRGNIVPGSGIGTMSSPDGVHWANSAYTPADSIHAPADTANNLIHDQQLGYLAYSRLHCTSAACNESAYGERRESRSVLESGWGGGDWTAAVEVLRGEAGYEMYSLVPWRAQGWAQGLYLGVGSFYATQDPEGHVYCELCSSTDHGASWTRVAPHQSLIPLGEAAGAWDSHTCYAAPPLVDPMDPSSTRFYYAGGNGPHSGGGAEHGRRNRIGLAAAPTDALVGLAPVDSDATVHTTPVQLGPGCCLWALAHATRSGGSVRAGTRGEVLGTQQLTMQAEWVRLGEATIAGLQQLEFQLSDSRLFAFRVDCP